MNTMTTPTDNYAIARQQEDDALNHLISVGRIYTMAQAQWHLAGAAHQMALANILRFRGEMENLPYIEIIQHNCAVAEKHLSQAQLFAKNGDSCRVMSAEIKVKRIADWLREFCNQKNIEVDSRVAIWCMPSESADLYYVVSLYDPAICAIEESRDWAVKQVRKKLVNHKKSRVLERTPMCFDTKSGDIIPSEAT